jgi:acyl dehydratase
MYTMALAARAVAVWFPGAEVVHLGCKFTNPVVVPAEGGVDVEVAGEVKPGDDGLTTVALTVTCAGQKVLGMPKAVVRA